MADSTPPVEIVTPAKGFNVTGFGNMPSRLAWGADTSGQKRGFAMVNGEISFTNVEDFVKPGTIPLDAVLLYGFHFNPKGHLSDEKLVPVNKEKQVLQMMCVILQYNYEDSNFIGTDAWLSHNCMDASEKNNLPWNYQQHVKGKKIEEAGGEKTIDTDQWGNDMRAWNSYKHLGASRIFHGFREIKWEDFISPARMKKRFLTFRRNLKKLVGVG